MAPKTSPGFEPFTADSLPPGALQALLSLRILANPLEYRGNKGLTSEGSLFEDLEEVLPEGRPEAVRWHTTNDILGETHDPQAPVTPEQLPAVVRRVAKSAEEQKRRVKAKAEVFTPAWVVNMQNNLLDQEVASPFNEEDRPGKTWRATSGPITFPEGGSPEAYITSRRLELCCGEGPYLFTPYDASAGVPIPLRDSSGNLQRVGLLDRKLRVVFEQVDTLEDWLLAAKIALRATYGFEWQGDSLILARLNMANTFFEYLHDFCALKGISLPGKKALDALVLEVFSLVSRQLWQMDGLKGVLPESCSPACDACARGDRRDHDGVFPLIPWGSAERTFEDFLT